MNLKLPVFAVPIKLDEVGRYATTIARHSTECRCWFEARQPECLHDRKWAPASRMDVSRGRDEMRRSVRTMVVASKMKQSIRTWKYSGLLKPFVCWRRSRRYHWRCTTYRRVRWIERVPASDTLPDASWRWSVATACDAYLSWLLRRSARVDC